MAARPLLLPPLLPSSSSFFFSSSSSSSVPVAGEKWGPGYRGPRLDLSRTRCTLERALLLGAADGRGELRLHRGGALAQEELLVRYARWTPRRNVGAGAPPPPTVLVFPSMSNTPFVADFHEEGGGAEGGGEGGGGGEVTSPSERGWWRDVVGHGDGWGIDLDTYDVICVAPLGSPHGTLAPLHRRRAEGPRQGEVWGPDFPQVTTVTTPWDQAAALTSSVSFFYSLTRSLAPPLLVPHSLPPLLVCQQPGDPVGPGGVGAALA